LIKTFKQNIVNVLLFLLNIENILLKNVYLNTKNCDKNRIEHNLKQL